MGLYGYPTQVTYNPMQRIYPGGYPLVQAAPVSGAMDPNTRQLVKFENFMEINQKFVASDTAGSAQVIVGTINVQQNLVTNFLNDNEATYKIYVQSSGDLQLAGQNIMIGLKNDCTTMATCTEIVSTVNVPPHINGFYVAGRTTGYNIDGMNSKTTLKGLNVQILNAAGDMIIGCTEAPLN